MTPKPRRLTIAERNRRISEGLRLAWKRARRKAARKPLTQEEAERAYREATAVPLSAERIEEIVRYATGAAVEPGNVDSVASGSVGVKQKLDTQG